MDADPPAPFPNADPCPRLVLFPLANGGVGLEWRLPTALIAQAATGFGDPEPIAKLYLRQLDAAGALRGETELNGQEMTPAHGHLRFDAPVVGVLQAELGLEGRGDGGWLLLARSNQLAAVPPSTSIPAPAAAADGATPERRPPPMVASGAPAPAPLVVARPQPAPAAEPVTPAPRPAARGSSRFPDPSLADGRERPLQHGGQFPIPIPTPIPTPGGRARERPPAQPRAQWPAPAEAVPAVSDASALRPPAAPEPDARSAASDQVALDQRRAKRQDVADPTRARAHGSGPLAPYPVHNGVRVHGQLRVFGAAPPGSLLDLGGHAFRVGPGGRFAFTVDLDDPDLLASLLARLPALPVAEREP
jgi:hypothetical protein